MNQTVILAAALSLAAGYLIGSISWAIIVSKMVANDDVRSHGSNNAGATNMLRTYGKLPAAMTFALDFFKGVCSAWVAQRIFGYLGAGDLGSYFGGFGALIGHIFPLYFGFRGGKGIATGLGAILAIDPLVFAIVAVVFVPIAPISGYVSLASVTGAGGFPLVLTVVRLIQARFSLVELVLSMILAGILIFTHRSNIQRLMSGTERKLSLRKKQ